MVDNSAIINRIDSLEARMDERHADLKARLDRINGSVALHSNFVSAHEDRLHDQYAAVKALQDWNAEQRGSMKTAAIVAAAIGGLIAMIGGPIVARFLLAVIP